MTHPLTAQALSPHHPGRDLAGRLASYSVLYHADEVNHCPGCGGTQWFVGRTTAQCARCDTALPLARIAQMPVRPLFVSHGTAACAA